MSKLQKPPIGVKPHWFEYQNRIEELASAIQRYVEYIKNGSQDIMLKDGYYALISRWAFELSELSKLEYKLLQLEGKNE